MRPLNSDLKKTMLSQRTPCLGNARFTEDRP